MAPPRNFFNNDCAPASPGCHVARNVFAQSIFGSNSNASSFRDCGHHFGAGSFLGAAPIASPTPRATQARQNGVNTRNGLPDEFRTSPGSNSNAELKFSVEISDLIA